MTRLRTSNLLLSFAGGAVALSLVGCGAVTVDAAPSALVESAYEPAGQNCQNGGAVITFGVDDNGDNDIQDAEITSRQYVCDGVDGVQGEAGADGAAGAAGADGAAGQNGAAGENGADGATPLVANRAATSEECAAGGYVFMTGFDDGAGDGSTAGDGVLSAGEVDASQLVCNGSMGAEGAAGADGATTLTSVREATAEECPTGGSVLMWGLDVNRDGNLDAATDTEAGDSGVGATDVDGDGNVDTMIEVTNQTVICNVTTALDTRLTAAEGTLATLEGDVSGLQTGLSQAESDIDGLQTDVSALGAGLTTVNGEVSDLGIALGALETRVVALETAVSDLDTTYATDADVATALAGYTLSADLDATYATDAAVTSALGDYTTTAALTTLLGDYALDADMTAAEADILDSVLRIDNVEFVAYDTRLDVDALESNYNDLQLDIIGLQSDVYALENEPSLADVRDGVGAGCTDGFVVTWNDTDGVWECAAIPATDLSAYTTTAGLTTLLGGYVTTTGLTTTLAGYVTPASLSTTLGAYTTTTALTAALGDYTTTAVLTSLLGDYALDADMTAAEVAISDSILRINDLENQQLGTDLDVDALTNDVAGLQTNMQSHVLAFQNDLAGLQGDVLALENEPSLADIRDGVGAGCTDGFVVTWNDTDSVWECAAIPATDLSAYTTTAGLTTLLGGYVTTTALSNVQNDVADVQGDVTNALIGVNNLDTRVLSLESSLVSLGYVESTVTHMSDDLKYGSGCANGDVLVWDPAVLPAGAWKCETPVDADTLGGISCPVDGDTVKFVAGTWVCDSRLNDVVADLYTGNVSDAVPYWNGTDWETGATGLYNDGLGTVSVGTVAAGTNLEVYGNFSLVNGTEGAGRVLSSDANGNASWVTNLSVAPAVVADFGVGYTGNSPSNEATGTSITLPPGKWSVQVTMLIAPTVTPTSTEAAWVRLHLSDTAGGVGTADTIPGAGGMVSGAVTGPSPYAVASGSIVLENIGPASKTYHLTKGPQANVGGYDINFSGLGGSGWGENAMIAYPMN